MTLTRESIKAGFVQQMVANSPPGFRALTEAELAASLEATLQAPGAPGDIWVFAYGSLIWNPAFHFTDQRIGILHGYHRRFCLWTHLGRGSPEAPGLILALEPGGSCRGVVYRIAADAVASELEIIWRREMVGGSYAPRWVDVRTSAGKLRALAFTMDRANARYAGRLSDEIVAAAIAKATGRLGPCSEYLFNTVAHLAALGIHDRPLERLRDRVVQRCAEAGPRMPDAALPIAKIPSSTPE